ncbi:unnamed protein product [Meganyctiphanes norvegica]|uniref:SGNH hydrolase-type esterase domain-containing protein n=1 Tax=Meganyctiphanes norvegica TaxID=48144 RepID=A0AAV2STH7_MEGNR
MANAAARPNSNWRQFVVKLNRFEFQLLGAAMTDGFLLTWCGDSHARNAYQRSHVITGTFPVAPTVSFVGRGGLTINTFNRNHLHEAFEDHAYSGMYRIAVVFLGSNDIDVATWPADTPLNVPANKLLALRQELLLSYDMVFVIGIPECDICRRENAQLVHQIFLRCNQQLNDVLRGYYIKLPNMAFNWESTRRFSPDDVHHSNRIYNSIVRLVGQRLLGVMEGDRRYVGVNEDV